MNNLSGLVSSAKYFLFPDATNAKWRSCVQNRFFALQYEIYTLNKPIVSSDAVENEDMVQTNNNENVKPAGEEKIIFDKISTDMMDRSGFNEKRFKDICTKLQTNSKNPKVLHDARKVIDALYSDRNKYYSIMDGETTICCPRLKEPHGEGKPASFFFSGTCNNNPELSENQNIEVLDCSFLVDSSRLTVNIQRSNYATFSKSASDSEKNYLTIVAWVKRILDLAKGTHERVMVMTYQKVASRMYQDLMEEYGDLLIPYPEKDGAPPKRLPYFGGTNGSNDYNMSTCFIQAGLNRFKPTDYLNRAISMVRASHKWASMVVLGNPRSAKALMDAMQAELLANDIIQAMYRCDLRNHSSSEKIVVNLFQPPDATVTAIRDQFPDATFNVLPELSEDDILAALRNEMYGDQQKHPAAVEEYLRRRLAKDSVTPVTADEIKEGTRLSGGEYNTAMKSHRLKKYMDEHFVMTGRGRNCKYTPIGSAVQEDAS